MKNINVQVYSLVSEPISPIEKLKTIAKLGLQVQSSLRTSRKCRLKK